MANNGANNADSLWRHRRRQYSAPHRLRWHQCRLLHSRQRQRQNSAVDPSSVATMNNARNRSLSPHRSG